MEISRRFENPTTKEICVFRTVSDEKGQPVLEMEYTIGVGGARPPEHCIRSRGCSDTRGDFGSFDL